MHEDRLTFRRAQDSDLPMLGHWLLTPAVARWYTDADYIEDLEDQLGDSRITMNLVLLDRVPVAYVQDYDIHAWKDHPMSFLPLGARGLDTFIGDGALIGKGLGSSYLRLRCDALFAEGVPALGIDPDEENHPAQRAFERAGFQQHMIAQTDWGRVVLMARSAPTTPGL